MTIRVSGLWVVSGIRSKDVLLWMDFKLKGYLFWLFQKHLYICDFIECKVFF